MTDKEQMVDVVLFKKPKYFWKKSIIKERAKTAIFTLFTGNHIVVYRNPCSIFWYVVGMYER